MTGLNRATGQLVVAAILIAAILAGIFFGCLKEGTTVDFTEDGVIPGDSIPPIDGSAPAYTETATFALGCFWAPDSRFGSLDGVVRTRVGYAGGTLENPTYHNLGDHTETIEIDYDPAQVSYEQLLEVYWDSHNPTTQPWSRQYMSIIFYHNSEQFTLATESKQREEASLGRRVYTEIIPFSEFYVAEDYHQKYHLQQVPELMEELTVIYPNFADFRDSTAVARINGYIGGHVTFEELQEQLNSSWPASG
ncbi:MAG: peptide-methionine (S)-S-oxide reductase MsrA [Dehalococcoidia bacterium]